MLKEHLQDIDSDGQPYHMMRVLMVLPDSDRRDITLERNFKPGEGQR